MLQLVREDSKQLPEFLFGDQVRFKQVLINVFKTFLSGISKCKASVEACYDGQSRLIVVKLEKDTGQIGAGSLLSDKSRPEDNFSQLRGLADSIGPVLC